MNRLLVFLTNRYFVGPGETSTARVMLGSCGSVQSSSARWCQGLTSPSASFQHSLLSDGSLNASSGLQQLDTAPEWGSCIVMLAGGCFEKEEQLCCTWVLQERLERSLKQDDGSSRNTYAAVTHSRPFRALVPLPYTYSRKSRPSLWRPAFPKALFPRGKGQCFFLCFVEPGSWRRGGSGGGRERPRARLFRLTPPAAGGIPAAASAGSSAPRAWRRPGVPEPSEGSGGRPGLRRARLPMALSSRLLLAAGGLRAAGKARARRAGPPGGGSAAPVLPGPSGGRVSWRCQG